VTASPGLTTSAVLELVDSGSGLDAAQRGSLLLEAARPDAARASLGRVGLGARDVALVDLRCATFGPTVPARVRCPRCETLLGTEIARDELVPDSCMEYVELQVGEHAIAARSPDGAALLRAAAAGYVEGARESLIRDCVLEASAGGEAIDPLELPEDVIAAVGEAIVAADPATEMRIDLACATCGLDWTPVLDIALFFWAELTASSIQILDDVHILAGGYGWSEPEVLALSARRRRSYVDRLTRD
jgi:hypothetical protein